MPLEREGEGKKVLFNQLYTTCCVYYLKYGKTLLGVQSHSHPQASAELCLGLLKNILNLCIACPFKMLLQHYSSSDKIF